MFQSSLPIKSTSIHSPEGSTEIDPSDNRSTFLPAETATNQILNKIERRHIKKELHGTGHLREDGLDREESPSTNGWQSSFDDKFIQT